MDEEEIILSNYISINDIDGKEGEELLTFLSEKFNNIHKSLLSEYTLVRELENKSVLNRLEKELSSLKEEKVKNNVKYKDVIDANNVTLEGKNKKIEEKDKVINELNKEVRVSRNKLELKESEVGLLTTEKNEFLKMIAVRDKIINNLKLKHDKISFGLDEKIKEMEKLKDDLLDEKNKNLPLNHKNQALKEEIDTLQSMNDFLEKEVKNKTNSIIQLRKDWDLEQTSYKNVCRKQQSEIILLKESLERTKAYNVDLQGNVDVQINEMKQFKLDKISLSIEYEKQIKELESSMEHLKDKINDDEKQLNSLNKRLKEQNDKYEDLIDEKLSDISNLEEVIEDRDSEIESLKKEISKKRTDFLKKGVSMTDIYTKYVEKSELLLEKEKELLEKNEFIQKITKEIEIKMPVLEKQRDDYEKTLTSHVFLTKRYNQLKYDYDQKISQLKIFQEENIKLQEDNSIFQKENNDFSNQIQKLLGNTIQDGDEILVEEGADEINSDIIISKHLVTFNDVKELQEKNRELLRALRKLSCDMETKSKDIKDNITQEYEILLNNAKNEISSLQEKYQRTLDEVEKLLEEKEVLMRLNADYQKGDNNTFDNNSLHILHELRTDFSKERKILQKELSKERESNLRNQEELAKNVSEIEFLKQRLGYSENIVKDLKSHLDIERESKDKLSDNLMKLEKCLNTSNMDGSLKNEEINKLKTQINNYQCETKYLKERYDTLNDHVLTLKKQKQQVEELFQKHRKDYSTLQATLNTEKDQLREELNESKFEYNQLRKEFKDKEISLEINKQNHVQIKEEFNQKINELEKELQNIKESNIKYSSENKTLIDRGNELKEENKKMSQRLNDIIRKSFLNETQDFEENTIQSQLDTSLREIKILQLHLEKEKDISQSTKLALDSKVEEYSSLRNDLTVFKSNLDIISKERDTLSAQQLEYEKKLNEYEKNISELQQKMESERIVIQETEQENDASSEVQESLQELTSELERQREMNDSTNRRYEEEVVCHGNKIEDLNKIKEEYHKIKTAFVSLEERYKVLEFSVEKGKESWNRQEETLRNEINDLKNHIADVEKQNGLLHNQIELDNNNNNESNQQQDTGTSETANDTVNDEVSNLKGLITYLRKENEISQSNLIVKERSVNKYLQLYDFSKRQIVDLQEEIKSLKQRIEKPEMEDEYEEKIKLLEQLTVYKENNSYLRSVIENNTSEKENFDKELGEIRQTLEKTKAELAKQIKMNLISDQDKKSILSINEKLKERVAELITKQDPENEREKLKNELEELEAQLKNTVDEFKAKETLLNEKNTTLDDKYKTIESKYKKLAQNFKKVKDILIKRKEESEIKNGELNELKGNNEKLQKANDELEKAHQLLVTEKELLQSTLDEQNKLNEQKSKNEQKNDDEDSNKDQIIIELKTELKLFQSNLKKIQENLNQKTEENKVLKQEHDNLKLQLNIFKEKCNSLQNSINKLNEKIKEQEILLSNAETSRVQVIDPPVKNISIIDFKTTTTPIKITGKKRKLDELEGEISEQPSPKKKLKLDHTPSPNTNTDANNNTSDVMDVVDEEEDKEEDNNNNNNEEDLSLLDDDNETKPKRLLINRPKLDLE